MVLTFYNTEKEPFEDIVRIGENAANQHFFLFTTVLSMLTLYNAIYIMSSANVFNLDKCTILFFGTELN